jgi:hypothetical protein
MSLHRKLTHLEIEELINAHGTWVFKAAHKINTNGMSKYSGYEVIDQIQKKPYKALFFGILEEVFMPAFLPFLVFGVPFIAFLIFLYVTFVHPHPPSPIHPPGLYRSGY